MSLTVRNGTHNILDIQNIHSHRTSKHDRDASKAVIRTTQDEPSCELFFRKLRLKKRLMGLHKGIVPMCVLFCGNVMNICIHICFVSFLIFAAEASDLSPRHQLDSKFRFGSKYFHKFFTTRVCVISWLRSTDMNPEVSSCAQRLTER